MLKLQDITCGGTQAELHQIPASLWQMPEEGVAAAAAALAAAVCMAKKKNSEHLDQHAAPPTIPPTLQIGVALAVSNSWSRYGRLESVANSFIHSEQLVEGERKVSWTSRKTRG